MSPDADTLDVDVRIDGKPYRLSAGISVAAALQGAGVSHTRHALDGAPRAAFCGMGQCFECRVRIDGREALACLTDLTHGMDISTNA